MKKNPANSLLVSAFISACLLIQIPLKAQETEKVNNRKLNGGFGHVSLSAEQINISSLNNSLLANGFGRLNNNVISLGGGGAFILNRVVIGGGGAWLGNSRVQNSFSTVELKGGYGMFNFGYVFFKGKKSLLFPSIGIGGGGYTLLITEKNFKNEFSQQLVNPAGIMAIQSGGWLTNLQLTYLLSSEKKNLHGFIYGIKAGYKYSPSNWKFDAGSVNFTNAPSINMNGFQLTLFLGGGEFD